MKRTMGLVAILLLGIGLGVGGTFAVQELTDESSPGFRSEVRERLAEEWGDIYAECIEEGQTPSEDFWEEDDSTPEVVTDVERLECRREADAILPPDP
jgi:hypothetical protein